MPVALLLPDFVTTKSEQAKSHYENHINHILPLWIQRPATSGRLHAGNRLPKDQDDFHDFTGYLCFVLDWNKVLQVKYDAYSD